MELLVSNLKRKGLDFPLGEVRQVNEEERSIVHIITDSTIDRSKDVVDPTGGDYKNYEKNPVVLFGHNYGGAFLTGSAPNIPVVGRSAWVKQEGETVISKTIFSEATELSRDAWNLAKSGFLPAVSIGFKPKGYEVTTLDELDDLNPSNRADFDKEAEVWVWRKWELLEYSLVAVPANPNAVEASYMEKAFDVVESQDMKLLLKSALMEKRVCELEGCAKEMEQKIDERIKSALEEAAKGDERILIEPATIDIAKLEEYLEMKKREAEPNPGENSDEPEPAPAVVSFDDIKAEMAKATRGVLREMTGKVD